MSRKSVVQMAGGKSPRQRIWEAIRGYAGSGVGIFTAVELSRHSKCEMDQVREYLTGLRAGGWIVAIDGVGYSLEKDNGIEAPRVRRDGTAVVQGSINEAMWGAICVLGTFTSMQVAGISGAAPATAKTYCRMLAKAGYLQVVDPGKGVGKGGKPTVWHAVKSRNTGPRAPMITRLKAVYDPNLHEVAWMDGADEIAEEMDDE